MMPVTRSMSASEAHRSLVPQGKSISMLGGTGKPLPSDVTSIGISAEVDPNFFIQFDTRRASRS